MGLLGGIVKAIGGPLVGGILGNSSSNKASKRAAEAQIQASREANALQEKIYGLNSQNISPFIERGNVAGQYYNALLGLPQAQQPQATAMPSNIPPRPTAPTLMADRGFGSIINKGRQQQYNNALASWTSQYGGMAQQTAAPQRDIQADAQGAMRQYFENSDYGFQFGEGANALNSGYAARGALESGAAMKAMEKYRQNLQAGYRNEYLGHLSGQQGAGLQGANALAGVSTNYANAANQNTMAAGQARANDFMYRGANNAAFYGAMGNLGSRLASSFPGDF